MAKLTLSNAGVIVTAGTAYDLSDHVDSVSIEWKKDTQETTAMGSGSRNRIPGLYDWTITVNFQQDFTAGSVDAAIYAAFTATTNPTITVKTTNAAASATNPWFTGTCIVPTYSPLSGKIGDTAMISVQFQGSGVLSRQTS